MGFPSFFNNIQFSQVVPFLKRTEGLLLAGRYRRGKHDDGRQFLSSGNQLTIIVFNGTDINRAILPFKIIIQAPLRRYSLVAIEDRIIFF